VISPHPLIRSPTTFALRLALGIAIGLLALPTWCAGARPPRNAIVPSAPPLKAKVSETLLGPQQSYSNAVFVSDDGGHAAVQTQKGSREVMLVDGRAGPLFDEVARCTAVSPACELSVAFSADGKRVAYLGHRGDQIIPVVDDKEADPVADVSNLRALGLPLASQMANGFFHFSPDGSRLAYISIAGGATSNMILDGKKGPDFNAIDGKQVRFAGNHLLYVAQDADGWHLVVNDKPRNAVYESISSLQVSPDGGHYTYIAERSGKKMVVADRTEGAPHSTIDALTILDSGTVSYSADGAVYIGDKLITSEAKSGSIANSLDSSAAGMHRRGRRSNPAELPYSARLAVSRDGSHYAFVKESSGGVVAVVDGKEQLQYEQISNLQFGPSGAHVAYIGEKRLVRYVVVDGVEMDGTGTVSDFRFSDDGNRFAYTAFKGSYTVVIDGKPSQTFREIARNSLTFSPDSQHCAYSAATGIFKWVMVLDDHSVPIELFDGFAGHDPAPAGPYFPPIVFSPDSKHIAYVASILVRGQAQSGAYVDRALAAPPGAASFPCFSPDSKHFAVVVHVNNNRWQVYVDGKAGPVVDQILEVNPHVVGFDDSHTLHVLCIKDGSLYRLSLDLGA
jgi:WD40-like Beta Propeller Repeat